MLSKIFPVAALAGMLTAGAASAVTVEFDSTATGPLEIGDTFSVTASASSGSTPFFGFEGEVDFDGAVIELTSVDIDAAFDFAFVAEDLTSAPVDVAGGTVVNPNPSGDLDLVTFNFTAIGLGQSPVSFDFIVVNSASETLVDTVLSTDVEVVTSDTTPIPLPASSLLLLGGIAAMPAARRWLKRA